MGVMATLSPRSASTARAPRAPPSRASEMLMLMLMLILEYYYYY